MKGASRLGIMAALVIALVTGGCQILGLGGAPRALTGADLDEDGSSGGGAGGMSGGGGSKGTSKFGPVSGIVLDADGRPAAGVTVTAYLTNSVPLAGNAGATLIGNAGSGLAGNAGATYRIQAAGEGTTDENGEFFLSPDATGTLNLEAVKDRGTKAWKARVTYLGTTSEPIEAGTLKLGPTGAITGKVTAPEAPNVTNFLGTDVFIPGSSYVAKTDEKGGYTLDALPAGAFDLVALKPGLGVARVNGVAVESKVTTPAPDLALKVAFPAIASVSPANAAPGAAVTITGESFGASTGATLQVTFNGAIATDAKSQDDGTITCTVPAGATSGDLVVNVSGLVSRGKPFQVLKTLALSAGDRELLVGSQFGYVATASDTAGADVGAPGVAFFLTGSGATASIDGATAKIDGVAPGDAVLTVTSGTLTQVARIHVFKVDKVSLDAASLALNVPPPSDVAVAEGFKVSGTLKASVTASDRADRAVVWSSAPDGLLVVTPGSGGVATIAAKAGTTGGAAVVTAKSADDGRRLATASVQVRNDASFLVEFE